MDESHGTEDVRTMTEWLVNDADKLDSTGEEALEVIQQLETDVEVLKKIREDWKSGDPLDTDELLAALKSVSEFKEKMMRAVKNVANDAKKVVHSATKVDDTVNKMPHQDLVEAMAFDAYDQFIISSVRKLRFQTIEAYEKQEKFATSKKEQANEKKIEWSTLNQEGAKTVRRSQSNIDALEEEVEELNKESERQANFARQTKQRAETLTLMLETLEGAQEEKEKIDKEGKGMADVYSEPLLNKVDEVYKTSVKFDELLDECLELVEEVDVAAGIKPDPK